MPQGTIGGLLAFMDAIRYNARKHLNIGAGHFGKRIATPSATCHIYADTTTGSTNLAPCGQPTTITSGCTDPPTYESANQQNGGSSTPQTPLGPAHRHRRHLPAHRARHRGDGCRE